MITNSFPEHRVMMGRVVSIVVAPPTEIGASLPKYFTSNGTRSTHYHTGGSDRQYTLRMGTLVPIIYKE